jgi:membrane protein implicated in regulation of membrane protease activity
MRNGPNPRDDDASARRARYFLYALGGVFVALGFALEMVPYLASVTWWWSGRVCALIGVVFLSIGRYASDRFVRRCESLLTGWG